MNKLSSLALGAALALATIGAAHAATSPVGAWKLSTGVADAPCTLTITAGTVSEFNGAAASAGDCNGTNVTQWHATGSNLELLAANGTLIAILHAKGEGYEGQRLSDGRKVALNH